MTADSRTVARASSAPHTGPDTRHQRAGGREQVAVASAGPMAPRGATVAPEAAFERQLLLKCSLGKNLDVLVKIQIKI